MAEYGLWDPSVQLFDTEKEEDHIISIHLQFVSSNNKLRILHVAVSTQFNNFIVLPADLILFLKRIEKCVVITYDCVPTFSALEDFVHENGMETDVMNSLFETVNQGRLSDVAILYSLVLLAEMDICPQMVPLDDIVQYCMAMHLQDSLLRDKRKDEKNNDHFKPEGNITNDIQEEQEPDSGQNSSTYLRNFDEEFELTKIPKLDLETIKCSTPGHLETSFEQFSVLSALQIFRARLYLGSRAVSLLRKYPSPEIYLNAVRKFGPLTEVIQVKGALALDRISKRGICIKKDRIVKVRLALEAQLHNAHEMVFPPYKDYFDMEQGWRTRSERDRVLEDLLCKALEEINKLTGRVIPYPQRKSGLPSLNHHLWRPFSEHHPFIKAWVDAEYARFMLTFLEHLEEGVAVTETSENSSGDKVTSDDDAFFSEMNVTSFLGELQLDEDIPSSKLESSLASCHRIFPSYTPLVRNGRTASSHPNMQNVPRKFAFRRCFVASPGHVLVAADYRFIELCTLAAVCKRRYGRSKLHWMINKGYDPHTLTASTVDRISVVEMEANLHSKNEQVQKHAQRMRRVAKTAIFGTAGGMGVEMLKEHINGESEMWRSRKEVARLRKYLTHTLYPELRLYLSENLLAYLAYNMKCRKATLAKDYFDVINQVNPSDLNSDSDDDSDEELMENEDKTSHLEDEGKQKTEEDETFLGFSGESDKYLQRIGGSIKALLTGIAPNGMAYNPQWILKVWKILEKHNRNSVFTPIIAAAIKRLEMRIECPFKEEDPSLGPLLSHSEEKLFFGRPVATLTGRLRANCSRTVALNTPFAGLAADGAKLALWDLEQLGYRVVAFIHDEVLIELPVESDFDHELSIIEQVMVSAMQRVLGKMNIQVTFAVRDSW